MAPPTKKTPGEMSEGTAGIIVFVVFGLICYDGWRFPTDKIAPALAIT